MGETNLDTVKADRFKAGSTELEASELAPLDGVTAGVVTASKALIAGASKEVAGRNIKVQTKADNYTVVAADSDTIILVTGVDKVITLPATVAGLKITVILAAAGLSAATGLSISPAAADKIMGNGFTSADNKDAILAGSGDREGDLLELVGDGVDGWYITRVIGTWTREG